MKETLRGIKRQLHRRVARTIWDLLMRPAQHRRGRKPFGAEELRLVRSALISQTLSCIDGKMVPAFERAFAETYGSPYAVGSTSGTAAIHVALGALDLEPGDEIITAPITDLGTIVPILYQGAIPVFADIDHSYNIDPADVERRITPRTRAIIAVHLFGNPCDMDALREIAARHRVALIEDCSQAHLARYKGSYVGTLGDIGCFSFQQSKHMTTGDGGMTITANKAYYDRMKLFADKGYARKGYGPRAYLFHAPNYRMTELVGAVGLAQLGKVHRVVAARRQLGEQFTRLLSAIPGITPAPVTPGADHSYWLYPVSIEGAEIKAVADRVRAAGIGVSAGYIGKPIYLCTESLRAKRTYGTSEWPFTSRVDRTFDYTEGLCPNAERALDRMICIPLDESWTQADVERAARTLAQAMAGQRGSTLSGAQPRPPVVRVTDRPEPRTRIGIVGCGQMGRWHLDAYRVNPRVEVVAVADTNLTAAENFGRHSGARAYPSHREMVAAERLDGVSVCTLPVSHRSVTIDLLEAGIHVLCEKPLATSAIDARAMRDAADARGLLVLPAFKFRFYEEVRHARDLIARGTLGRLVSARLMFGGAIDMSASWYGRKQLSGGGVILDNGPHAADLIRFLFGEIADVRAATLSRQPLEVEDTAQLVCRLEDATTIVADLSWSVAVPSQHYLEIYGDQGTALLDSNGLSFKAVTWNDWKRIQNQATVKQAFARQIDHFVEALATRPTIVTNEDGPKSQLVVEAAYESAGRGGAACRVVELERDDAAFVYAASRSVVAHTR